MTNNTKFKRFLYKMDVSKDYYAILGILPSAELLVIKAAHKAMLKVYHPDKFKGTNEEAHLKTVDINEAYRILSCKDTKDKYDKIRAESSHDDFSHEEENESYDEHQKTASHTFDKDWIVATKYKPNLIDLEKKLSKISSRLAFTFRVQIIENKAFEHAENLAIQLEKYYFESYFGTNDNIINFAKRLISDGHKKAANELNQAVKVFGKVIDADKVIYKIKSEFKLYEESSEQKEKTRTEQEKNVKAENHNNKKSIDARINIFKNTPQRYSLVIILLLNIPLAMQDGYGSFAGVLWFWAVCYSVCVIFSIYLIVTIRGIKKTKKTGNSISEDIGIWGYIWRSSVIYYSATIAGALILNFVFNMSYSRYLYSNVTLLSLLTFVIMPVTCWLFYSKDRKGQLRWCTELIRGY